MKNPKVSATRKSPVKKSKQERIFPALSDEAFYLISLAMLLKKPQNRKIATELFMAGVLH